VAPSRNFTFPVGVPAGDTVTVAVNVTCWPVTDGLLEEETVVDVVAGDSEFVNPVVAVHVL
jgi:hypothetical protein